MNVTQWLALSLALMLGAMSPGPSLALVIRNTIFGSRTNGIFTGIGHGLGFGIYAFITAVSLSILIEFQNSIEMFLRISGTIILLWISYKYLTTSNIETYANSGSKANRHSLYESFSQGFVIALFNPKILAWMIAVYAPLIKSGHTLIQFFYMGLLGTLIDGLWYISVATILSYTSALNFLQTKSGIINKMIGILLALYAVGLALNII
ncbi:MAG: LysE family translocator, partial [Anaerolineales bacterium]|nr:LysE family translocator [Anaerolineales bacterium]